MIPSVQKAEYVHDYLLNLTFQTGEVKQFDMAPYLENDSLVFRPLKQPDIFQMFVVDNGTVVWITGADMAPERLYTDGTFVK